MTPSTPSNGARFRPDSAQVYRVFFRETDSDGAVKLKQLVGFVETYDDGSALVRPGKDRPATYLRSYEKLVEYVPSESERLDGRSL